MPKLKRNKGATESDDQYNLRLGQAIVDVFTSLPPGAVDVDRLALINAIKPLIKSSAVEHGVTKRYAFDVIVDPIEKNNEKFAFIVIPAPEPGQDIKDWAANYYNSDDKKRELGKVVLFGCGR